MENDDEPFASQHGFGVTRVDDFILVRIRERGVVHLPINNYFWVSGHYMKNWKEPESKGTYVLLFCFHDGEREVREAFNAYELKMKSEDLERIMNFISDKVFHMLQH